MKRIFVVAFWGVLGLCAKVTAEELPLEYFARNAQYESIKISPGGEYLAAIVPYQDQNALVVIDRSKMAILSSIHMDRNQKVGTLHWANDNRIVAKILSLQSADDRLADYGELFAMDANGKRKKLIYGYRVGDMSTGSRIKKAEAEWEWGTVIDRLPNHKKHVLIVSHPFSANGGAIPTVYLLNVYTGVKKQLVRLPVANARVISDAALEQWAASGTDKYGIQGLYWRNPETRDWELVLKGASMVHDIRPVAIASDGGTLDILTNIDTPTLSLTRINLETRERRTLLTDARYDIRFVTYGSDSYRLLGACFYADRPRCNYLDLNQPESALLSRIRSSFPEQFVFVSNWTRDGSEAVLRVSGDRNPGDYFLMDVAKLKVEYLLSSTQWIDPNLMARKMPIAFKARDGMPIEGYLTLPVGKEKNLPTVVLVHGGPHGPRDSWYYQSEVQLLANRGYAVLQVNYRGSGGYGADFERAGYRRWGTTIQDDITDGVGWAVTQGYVDPDRICISGGSFGGYSALMSASREPDLYRCAIGYVGVYDLGLMFKSGDIPDSRSGREYLSLVLGNDSSLHYEQSPINHVGKIKAALMISYGKRDNRAPPVQSRRLVEALDKAGKPYQLVVERREGHGFVNEATRLKFFQKKLAFLDQHIGTGATTTESTEPAADLDPALRNQREE